MNKEEAAAEAEVMGFVRVEPYFICKLLRAESGNPGQAGILHIKAEISLKELECQAEWEALANGFGCHIHKEVNP